MPGTKRPERGGSPTTRSAKLLMTTDARQRSQTGPLEHRSGPGTQE